MISWDPAKKTYTLSKNAPPKKPQTKKKKKRVSRTKVVLDHMSGARGFAIVSEP